MNRNEMIARVEGEKKWDIIVIGGGATGAGTALDAASRGYKTLLLEKNDFAQGTSSRSTKLIHGGVRYLQQGNVALVLEALKERGVLKKNAPHLVYDRQFVVPNYAWWEGPFYGIGLKLYDLLAGNEGLGPSRLISKEETIKRISTVEQDGLNGGVLYYDGQFDDARLVINLLQTAAEQGAAVMNYMPVTRLIKVGGFVTGVAAIDSETGKEYELPTQVVVNATGPYTDSVRVMDNPECIPMINPSQGVHIVLHRSFLPGDNAIMVPHTDDGRVLFAIPWHNKVVVGTTDTPLEGLSEEPVPMEEEVRFLLEHVARYLEKDPGPEDVRSMFAGIRPLVSNPIAENTAAISREHVVHVSKHGLVTIAGGKWTTYRKMAEDTVEQAILVGQLKYFPCQTETLQVHGYHLHANSYGPLSCYGSDANEIKDLINAHPELDRRLHPASETVAAEVVWAAREEMTRNVESFLSRRRRMLLLDARAADEMAPSVAEILAKELGHGKEWQEEQVRQFSALVEKYILK